MIYFTITFLLFIVSNINAQIPCDEAYGQFCPTASSWEVQYLLTFLLLIIIDYLLLIIGGNLSEEFTSSRYSFRRMFAVCQDA